MADPDPKEPEEEEPEEEVEILKIGEYYSLPKGRWIKPSGNR